MLAQEALRTERPETSVVLFRATGLKTGTHSKCESQYTARFTSKSHYTNPLMQLHEF